MILFIMINIKEWLVNKDDIKIDALIKSIEFNIPKFLDTSKDMQSELEKYVYNTSMFHIKRLNLTPNLRIKYTLKNNSIQNRLFFSEHEKERPIFSSLTYLSDDNRPSIFTNINYNSYKYKKKTIYDNPNIILSFPRLLKTVTLENYTELQGDCTIFDYYMNDSNRTILYIEFFNDLTKKLTIDESSNNLNILEKNNTIKEINLNSCVTYTDKVLEEIIYNPTENTFQFFVDYLLKNEYNKYDNFLFNKEHELANSTQVVNPNNSGREKIDTSVPKFIQRFIKNTVYNKDTCNWIIKECEMFANENVDGWTKSSYINYPGFIQPIQKVTNVYSFISFSCNTLCKQIATSYCLDDTKIEFNIREMFILRYKGDADSCIESTKNDYSFTLNISLKPSELMNEGGTMFNDGIFIKLNEGDMLIHSNNTNYYETSITNGIKYSLIIFIDILGNK